MPLPRSLPRSLGSPQIYFWEVQRRNLTERVKTLFLAENSVKLKNLTGYTAYMVSVAAFNAAGDGPRSTPTRGQTQQAGREKSWGFGGDLKTTPGIRAVSCSQEAGFDSQALLPGALQRENPACQEGSRYESRRKETLTTNLETNPRSHPACSTHLVSALGLASTPGPYLASSSFLLSPCLCSSHRCLLYSMSPHFCFIPVMQQ